MRSRDTFTIPRRAQAAGRINLANRWCSEGTLSISRGLTAGLGSSLFLPLPVFLGRGRGARIVMRAAAEEMRRRTPGMMRDAIEPSRGVDPREGLRGGQLSRHDRGEGLGAMVPLQRVEVSHRTLHLGERGGDLGRNAPADGRGQR